LSFARPLAELELADLDLRALAEDVANVLADRAALAGVVLVVRGGPTMIRGDARRLREAVLNLTTNALAATPPGGEVVIAVGASTEGSSIHVTDTGTGMPSALVDAPPFTTTRADGTGLGLPIARGAVTQHGGSLAFAVRAGGGTIATITLPRSP
ncbi:MAG TPA: HAMP domain-containing sensor histidine kinase, partial [Kofleriaceae bacterium]|nr:HAMP domain-containing sensor histidine kinase [Kofleriaceae bacterium]